MMFACERILLRFQSGCACDAVCPLAWPRGWRLALEPAALRLWGWRSLHTGAASVRFPYSTSIVPATFTPGRPVLLFLWAAAMSNINLL